MRKRYPYIKKSLYLKLLKEIKLEAKKINVDVVLYYRPIKYNRYGGSAPNFGECSGYYSQKDKKIRCTFFGKIGNGKKLNLILHELRHAIHDAKKLYKDYYNPLWEKPINHIKATNKKPCLKTAFLAEIDCNKFAYYWLRNKGINIPKNFKYTYQHTLAYRVTQELQKA